MTQGALLVALSLTACAPTAPPQQAAPPRLLRVMSINQCTDQLALLLLPSERIVSVSWLSRDARYSAMADAARAVPTNRATAEEVLRDRPDLLLADSFAAPATRALLERMGMPVLELAQPTTLAEVRAATRAVAAAVGERARGEALVAAMDADLAALARTPVPPVRVANWGGDGLTAQPGPLRAAVLAAAGAQDVSAQARGVDVEALLTLAPAVLVRDAAVEESGRRRDRAEHPLVRARWAGRQVMLPETATICGTPLLGAAAAAFRQDLVAASQAGSGRR